MIQQYVEVEDAHISVAKHRRWIELEYWLEYIVCTLYED